MQDGELVVQGLATPMVMAGYLLAKRTHAPNVRFISAIGQGLCERWAPLGLARVESLWLNRSLLSLGFVRGVADVLPRVRPREFFRPGQVDAHGNFNNLALGRDAQRPRLRLPGSGGIPDVTTFLDKVCLYVPRHSRVTFVERVDWISGLGHTAARERGRGPTYLVSDLGQFDFAGDDQRMRLVSVHAGVTPERVQAKTGFQLELAPDLGETPAPSAEELRLLREEIDPLGVRALEGLSGAARKEALRRILEQEGAA